MRGPGWHVDGVDEDRFLSMLYSEPAEAIIAHFERDVRNQKVRSIYVRHRDERVYQRLDHGMEFDSAQGPVCAAKAPVALFLVDQPRPGGGANTIRLARCDLSTREVTTAIDAKTFAERHDGGWMSKLLACSDDGRSVQCVLARWQPPRPDGGRSVEYFLARLNLETTDYEELVTLANHCF